MTGLANALTDEELWAELARRGAALRVGYCYPAAAADEEATALVHEHGYEFGPFQLLELGHRLAEPPQWTMYADVPTKFRPPLEEQPAGVRSWLDHPDARTCPKCGDDCATVAITDLAYLHRACECPRLEYAHLVEQLWHLACLVEEAPQQAARVVLARARWALAPRVRSESRQRVADAISQLLDHPPGDEDTALKHLRTVCWGPEGTEAIDAARAFLAEHDAVEVPY